MKLFKICTNEACIQSTKKKKKKYKKTEEQFCPYCGQALAPVCRQGKCLVLLGEGDGEGYCPEHLEAKRESDKKKFELLTKVSVAAAVLGVSAKIIYDGLSGGKKR